MIKRVQTFSVVAFAWSLLLCVSTVSLAGDRGLAWKLSKDGKVGYAVGSVHLADASFYPLNPEIVRAFDASDTLIVEADESQLSSEQQREIVDRYGLYPEGESFKEHLSEQLVDQISAMFASFGVDVAMLERYKPGMLGVTLSAIQAQALGYSARYGLDNYFLEKARFKKRILEVESFEQQMQLLSQLPDSDDVMRDAFMDMADFEESWADMMGAWRLGDANAMYEHAIGKALKDFPTLAEFHEVLFFRRNPAMASTFAECFVANRCFLLVGAGHLVGPRGVIEILEEKGFQVEQLP